jgi:pyridoxamine 5'-phosphate oxidase
LGFSFNSPDFWAGYRVAPRTIEFWQGGKYRLHDRFQYRREEAGWTIEQLAP